MPPCGIFEPALVHSPRVRARLSACSASFHSAARRYLQAASHYDILEINPNASQGEIKRQFYSLSKQHHPDLHPNDPSASGRFQTISAAYHILSDPSKRAQYDRDSGFGAAAMNGAHAPSGSYSSAQARSGPYGARPASGLSKRRTAFRGPPPSFYRAGGYGAQAEKRRAASQEAGASSAQGTTGTDTAGGFSPGQGTYDKYWNGNVSHFDRQAHFERQEEIDNQILQRRRARRRGEGADRDYIDRDFITRFILVGSLVLGGWLAHLPFTHG